MKDHVAITVGAWAKVYSILRNISHAPHPSSNLALLRLVQVVDDLNFLSAALLRVWCKHALLQRCSKRHAGFGGGPRQSSLFILR